MKCSIKLGNLVAGIFLAVLSAAVYADNTATNPELPTAASFYTNHFQSLKPRSFDVPPVNVHAYNSAAYLLATNEEDALLAQDGETPVTPVSEFKPPLISGRKIHEYFGLSTVVLAGLTMMAAPDTCENNCSGAAQTPRQTSGTTHTRLARATAAMAAATVMTGLVYHWNDIHWEDPFTDPDKMHARLATAGALMMLYAVHKSSTSTVPTSHAGIAEAGAVAMLVAIKLTW